MPHRSARLLCWLLTQTRVGAIAGLLAGGTIAIALPSEAQIIPDGTLGAEGSVVTEDVEVRGALADRIDGGAQRGANLFHSFSEFNVGEGQRVYFGNPAAVEHIFSRVTGENPSGIFGTLGVDGAANLFFLNPNGIFFGPGASLDVEGSFAATTANAVQFGAQESFSASDPEVPSQLLTVSPSAFLFNQFEPSGIVNTSIAPAGESPSGIPIFGLRVPQDQNLLLVGGDIFMAGGGVFASSGRIELTGLSAPGAIGLTITENRPRLEIPDNAALSNLTLANDSVVGLLGSGGGEIDINANVFSAIAGGRLASAVEGDDAGGSITVNANQVNLTGVGQGGASGIVAQNLPNVSGQVGDIVINTNLLTVQGGAQITSSSLGPGGAGDVSLTANTIELPGSFALPNGQGFDSAISSQTTGSGNAGNIVINTGELLVEDGGQISASTFDVGDAGDVDITATSVEVLGASQNTIFSSSIGSTSDINLITGQSAVGDAGEVTVSTQSLSIRDGGAIQASTAGSGRAGDIDITAETTEVAGISENGQQFSRIVSNSVENAFTRELTTGASGNIEISTQSLSVRDGAQISTDTASAGQGGRLTIFADESTEVIGSAILANGVPISSSLSTQTGGTGRAGDLRLETGRLVVQDEAIIAASTLGAGRAGNVDVIADSIEMSGEQGRLVTGGIGSRSEFNPSTNVIATGDAGDVTVTTRTLNIRGGSRISTDTAGEGRGGNLSVMATESARLVGSAVLADGSVVPSSLSTQTLGSGSAGNLVVEAGRLLIQEGATIAASTLSSGDAGDVQINADSIEMFGGQGRLTGGGIGSRSEFNSFTGIVPTGDAGNVTITTQTLNIRDGHQISTDTVGAGQGGRLTIFADESTELIGSAILANGVPISSSLSTQTGGTGRAGDLRLETGQLVIQDGATVAASTFGSGDAGNVEVFADSVEMFGEQGRLFSGGIGSRSELNQISGMASTGDAGNVAVTTRILNIRDGSLISTDTAGTGRGGNINVTASESTELNGSVILATGITGSSGLSTQAAGSGNAGNLRLETGQLTIQNGAAVSAATVSSGSAGNVEVFADSIEMFGEQGRLFFGGIGSRAELNQFTGIAPTGDAGDVTVRTRTLSIGDGHQISTDSAGTGQGGNLTVVANESTELRGLTILANGAFISSSLSTQTQGSGNAGSLNLETGRLVIQDEATIAASTFGSGDAGDIEISADSIELFSSQEALASGGIGSRSEPIATGDAGDITVSTRLLDIRDGQAITTTTFVEGEGGDLNITVEESATLRGTIALPNGSARSGLSTGTLSSGDAGNLTLTVGDQLTIAGGASIGASTLSPGAAGEIRITADTIRVLGISEDRQSFSSIESTSTPNVLNTADSGNAGDVSIATRLLNIQDGGAISTATAGGGQGGRLDVIVDESANFTGSSTLANDSSAQSGLFTLTLGAENAGRLRLRAGELTLRDGAVISTETLGGGNAGRIRVIVDGDIDIGGVSGNQGQISSRISSSVSPGGRGNAGDLFIRSRSLSVEDGGQIAATVSRPQRDILGTLLPGGRGRGGNIVIRVSGALDLTGISTNGFSSGILSLTEREAVGPAGNIDIGAGDLSVADGAIIVASTFNGSNGGDIEISAQSLDLNGGGQIVTSTRNEGNAGRISVTVDGDISISGTDMNFSDRLDRVREFVAPLEVTDLLSDVVVNQGASSGIFANTESESSIGNGGSIRLDAENLQILDQAAIVAQSEGQGLAGSITLNIDDRLEMTDGNVVTEAFQSSGGDIRINSSEDSSGIVLLRGDSDITTSSQRDGGNIIIRGTGVIAFDDADILTTSEDSRGGDITLSNFFSSNDPFNGPQPLDGNDRVDVNAEGELASGTIDSPDTSFIQNSLADLPEGVINTESLIANSCVARNEDGSSTFNITGAEGLRDRPGDAASSYSTGDVQPVSEESSQGWDGGPIVEAEGVYQLPNGELIISHACTNQ